MKNFLKHNFKFLIGLFIGLLISGISVYATTFAGSNVSHKKSDGTTTTVTDALNDLYSIYYYGNATSANILSGKTAFASKSKLTGTMPNRGNLTDAILKGSSFPAGYYSGWNFTRLQYSNATRVGWYSSNGTQYGHVHFPEGYYFANGTDWAPEIRLTKAQIESMAKDSGITTTYYNNGKAQGQNEGAKTIVNSLYTNSMASSNGTLLNINCSAGYGGSTTHNSDGGGGIWSRDWYDYSNSVNIPLYKYNSSGSITEVLNVIIVTATAKVSGTFWGGSGSSSTTSYSMKTNKGNTIQSTKSVSASGDTSTNTVPTTYNLFGISGLSGAESITLSGSGSVSAAINGASRGDFDVGQSADSSITYNLQYIKVQ